MISIKDAVQDIVNKRRTDGVMNYISPSYISTNADAPVGDVLRTFATNPSPNFSVIVQESEASRKLRGIITRSDLGRGGDTAEQIASTPVIAIRNVSSLGDALDILNGGNSLGLRLDCLPVVNESDALVGVLTLEGINKKIRESL